MVCLMFGATPSPEPMQTYCQLDNYEQNSVKHNFTVKKMQIGNVVYNMMAHIVLGSMCSQFTRSNYIDFYVRLFPCFFELSFQSLKLGEWYEIQCVDL